MNHHFLGAALFVASMMAGLPMATAAAADPAKPAMLASRFDKAAAAAIAAAIAAGDPEEVAATPRAVALADSMPALNDIRLALKADEKAEMAEDFLDALNDVQATPAAAFNLALARTDRLPGYSLLWQGRLSTSSQSAVEPYLDDPTYGWLALYVTGINNLYWPDFFQKSDNAEEYLSQAVALSERSEAAHGLLPGDMYALGYLSLGDAYALLDEPAKARAAWAEGHRRYPYVSDLAERQAIADEKQHEVVRAIRDANVLIDTGLDFLWQRSAHAFTVDLTGGDLYGPGPMPDQPLEPGRLNDLRLDHALSGVIPPNNNGGEEPNAPGELRQGLVIDGKFSDGTLVQESVDVGYVELLNGQFKLFLAAIQSGKNEGVVEFFLDRSWHWTIHDDIGIDPGFAVGVIKFEDFTFSTSPRVLPYSWQTEKGVPGAMDRAGSLASNDVVPGRIGDADFDGFVDGTFNAVGRFPLTSIILPGAPFGQIRHFVSDVPIRPEQAAFLALANKLNHLVLGHTHPHEAEAMFDVAAEREAEAVQHLGKAELSVEARASFAELVVLTPESDLASVCGAGEVLDRLGPTLGLFNRQDDVSGITSLCDAR